MVFLQLNSQFETVSVVSTLPRKEMTACTIPSDLGRLGIPLSGRLKQGVSKQWVTTLAWRVG